MPRDRRTYHVTADHEGRPFTVFNYISALRAALYFLKDRQKKKPAFRCETIQVFVDEERDGSQSKKLVASFTVDASPDGKLILPPEAMNHELE